MKTYKKLASFLLAVLMLIMAAMPAAAAVNDTGFADVNPGDWFGEAVAYCRNNGLMVGKGNGRFAPNDNMTRAELVTVLYRAAGEPAVTSSNPFTDVSSGRWYTNAVLWAQQNDIVNGYGSGRFGTNDPVRREQIAAILWRDAGEPAAEPSTDFADESAISNYASTAVDWARANGIVSGKGNNRFDPQGSATRAEVATMLMNYKKLNQDTPTPSPDPNPNPNPDPNPVPEPDPEPSGAKVLVAYFSATNNTKGVANHIKTTLGDNADLLEIVPADPYTSEDLNYNNTNCRANLEQNDDSARPAIAESCKANMADYDIIFLGYPIWWGKAPKIIHTFLEAYNFSGKTIVPFCTSGGSGYNDSTIKPLAPDADWLTGRRFSGGASFSTVESWVNSLDLNLN